MTIITLDQAAKDKALETIANMASIVQAEMLIRGKYVTDVVDQSRAESGAICGGRKFCAIGTLMISYGIPLELSRDGVSTLGAAETHQFFVEQRRGSEPALALVYDTLNDLATEFVLDHWNPKTAGRHQRLHYRTNIEHLFEGWCPCTVELTREHFLDLLGKARMRVEAAPVEATPENN